MEQYSLDEADAEDNVAAFLQTIRAAEGTAGENGYRTLLFGLGQRSLFSNGYADHPRIARQSTDRAGRRFWTSAAGAYLLSAVSPIPDGSGRSTSVDTWDRLKRKLSLPDFSPAAQDRAAVELLVEAGALPDVHAGRFAVAIDKVRHVWPLLAGAGGSISEEPLGILRAAYLEAGAHLS